MTEQAGGARPATPVLYVTDLTFALPDPADLFDIAFLLRSPEHALRGVCLPADGDGARVLDALTARARAEVPSLPGAEGLGAALAQAREPVSLVVVAGYGAVAEALARDREAFRAKVARVFLIGGHVNDYARPETPERLPINPRLRERHPERFAGAGDPRLGAEGAAFARLLTSGEAVIWLPRDICLWRYAAPGALADGGPVAEFLLRELSFWHLRGANPAADRYEAADRPVLLSALPASLLARQPDPFAWMRQFRAMTARVETDAAGAVSTFTTATDAPNLYAVVAIDGQTLGRLLTARLRDRPPAAEEG